MNQTERRCVIEDCTDYGQHLNNCDGGRCRGCRPRHTERGLVCNICRTRIGANLADIPSLVEQLEDEPDPVDRTPWRTRQLQKLPNPTTNPHRYPAWTPGPWTTEPGAEPLAQTLPMGITARSVGAPVSGSRQPPTPIGVNGIDRLDLTAPARHGSIEVIYRGRHSHTGGDPDQIGHLAVATELDFWVRDWIAVRELGEHLPAATVAVLASWLQIRLDWACAHQPSIDEFAAQVGRLRSALRAALRLNPARKELCRGVACRSCGRQTIYRDRADIQCGWCRQYYSERDYAEWTALLDADAKRRIKEGVLKEPLRRTDRPERTSPTIRVEFPAWVKT